MGIFAGSAASVARSEPDNALAGELGAGMPGATQRDAFVPPGSRGRLGVIQPAPGLMLEAEWRDAVPPGVAFPVTRLALFGSSAADYAAMAEQALQAAAILANAGGHVIGYACGIGSLFLGPAYESALMTRLSEAAGGIYVLGMAEAALGEIKRLGARRVTLLTPYPAPINALVQRYAEDCGIIVSATAGLPVADPVAATRLSADQTVQAAAEAVALAPTDLLWIPCGNVRAIDLCARIQAETGCPCVSSNQTLLKAMLA